MNHQTTNRELCLEENEGWQYIPFSDKKSDSFYDTIIENQEITLAWIAHRENVSNEDLKKHHFIREEFLETGIGSYNPRLLIIKTKNEWYLSKIGSNCFIKATFSFVLMQLCENIKVYLSYFVEAGANEYRISQLVSSMDKLKQRVRDLGKKEDELNEREEKLFANAEPDIDDSYKGMYEVGKMRSDAIEKMWRSASNELHDLSLLIHYYICNNFNIKQVRVLLRMNGKFVYVNPWFNKNELLIKVTQVDLYLKRDHRKKLDQFFILVHPSGETSKIEIEKENASKQLKPGFCKLNTKMLNEFLKCREHE